MPACVLYRHHQAWRYVMICPRKRLNGNLPMSLFPLGYWEHKARGNAPKYTGIVFGLFATMPDFKPNQVTARKRHLSLKTTVLTHAVKALHRQNYSPWLSSCAIVPCSKQHESTAMRKQTNQKAHVHRSSLTTLWSLRISLCNHAGLQTKSSYGKKVASQFENYGCSHMQPIRCIDKTTLHDCHLAPLCHVPSSMKARPW